MKQEASPSRPDSDSDVLAPVFIGICAFLLYFFSSPPDVGLWDTAEFQTVVWIAGIPHPTGFPAFIITGWLFTHLVPFGNPAWRLTMMAATAGALSCALLVGSLRRFGVSPSIALASGAVFATGELTWIHSTRAGHESLALLFSVLAIVQGVIWAYQRERRALICVGLFTGLALATHPITLWCVPGLLLLVAEGLRGRPIPWRAAACSAFSLLAGLSLYAYLPIRSAIIDAQGLDPTTSLGIPPGQQIWNCDNPSTLAGFMHLVSGADFHATSYLQELFNLSLFPAFFKSLYDVVVTYASILVAASAILGIILTRHRRFTMFALTLTAFFPVCTAYVVAPIEGDVTKFFLVPLWIVVWLAGLGAQALVQYIPAALATAPALALAMLAGISLQSGAHDRFAQRLDTSGQTVIADVLAHTEDNAVINGQWSDLMPIAYGRYVERVLGARIPVPIADRAQLLAWSRTRPVYWIGAPDGYLQSTPGAVVTLVPNTLPPLYRITPAR